MTESDWLTCTDPQAMLALLRGTGLPTDRKLRLFACACCRRIWPLLEDERSRRAVEAGEKYADGLATADELAEAFRAAAAVSHSLAAGSEAWFDGRWAGAAWADSCANPDPAAWEAAAEGSHGCGPPLPAQADLLRDLFGPPPFRTPRFDPRWR